MASKQQGIGERATASRGDPSQSYNIGKTLGQGSFGIVKLATDKADGTQWAVKCVSHKNLSHEDMDGLDQEIRIMQQLSHRNIVHLRHVFYDRNTTYLIMEPMHGGELFDRIVEKDHYSETEASQVLMDVASALHYCHSQGVAHRDLKPENLLYASKDDAAPIKVADFGLARLFGQVDHTMNTACGTPNYVAPEVLMNQGYDERADWWSLGVIFYILLCGFPPFYDDSNKKLFKKIKKGQYDFPSPYWDEVGEAAKELVQGMLNVDPQQRFGFEEIANHRFTKDHQVRSLSHKSSAIQQLKRFNARRKFKAGVMLALASQEMNKLKAAAKKKNKKKKNTSGAARKY